ncbi:Sugar kinase of the NBD/HSP70 family, may contain an N-terminal HTH domain [Shimia gijangensis]|uniref:Sugar kinase of the NBD/HSP70 family, may contain an N-terminal HTH domain n=1 Tax=Shimia gijangensis TaxID=1470563 RepID=A0A1M6CK05_9RHOB|nr:ROK family transcriptional regulator [Shimia gijangensis]SHI61337.1 Sugar kinase of the NBD/HSP70 family, may contain an N-terminal HTH domain [Shimia gijangensis]
MAGEIRNNGRRALLAEIRRNKRIPRIDLAERTGISRATVTTITADLLKEGLIEEVREDVTGKDNRRGRPKVDLKIRGAARHVVGIKVANKTISTVLHDFEGAQIADHDLALEKSVFGANELAEKLAEVIAGLVDKAGLDAEDISGVGVGIAGTVDALQGFVYWSPSLVDRNLALGQVLKDHLGVPVFIDNDANLVAVAERSFGLGQEHSDFIVVTIESGVGMGIVIGNELYRGNRGCGAEFGHTKVQLDGALCRCGQRGCLEAYVADYALLREATVAGGNPADDKVENLLGAARHGDPLAKSIVDRAGRMFAMGLSNIVNIFDPELIILSGEQMQSDHLYAEDVIEAMRKSVVQIDKAGPEVVVHQWGDLMWAQGAAAYALDEVSELAVSGIKPNAV